jgi:hypothetical protein
MYKYNNNEALRVIHTHCERHLTYGGCDNDDGNTAGVKGHSPVVRTSPLRQCINARTVRGISIIILLYIIIILYIIVYYYCILLYIIIVIHVLLLYINIIHVLLLILSLFVRVRTRVRMQRQLSLRACSFPLLRAAFR